MVPWHVGFMFQRRARDPQSANPKMAACRPNLEGHSEISGVEEQPYSRIKKATLRISVPAEELLFLEVRQDVFDSIWHRVRRGWWVIWAGLVLL